MIFDFSIASQPFFQAAMMFIQKIFDLIKNFLQKDYARFMIVGAGGFAIHLAIASFCFRVLKYSDGLSFSIGFVLATTYAFFLNKLWVFSNNSKKITSQYVAFFVGRLLAYVVTLGTTFLMTRKLGIIFEVSQVANTLINFMINYFFAKLVVFRKPKANPGPANESSR